MKAAIREQSVRAWQSAGGGRAWCCRLCAGVARNAREERADAAGVATDPPLRVELHDELRREMRELGRSDPREVTAVRQARTALAALGHDPGHPLTSAVRGPLGRGLRELRPRAGRSRYRVLYARRDQTLAMLALAPEAQHDPRGFARALRTAHT